jgi:hypothetical protein
LRRLAIGDGNLPTIPDTLAREEQKKMNNKMKQSTIVKHFRSY